MQPHHVNKHNCECVRSLGRCADIQCLSTSAPRSDSWGVSASPLQRRKGEPPGFSCLQSGSDRALQKPGPLMYTYSSPVRSLTASQRQRGSSHGPTSTQRRAVESEQRETTRHLLAVASNCSGIRPGNFAPLSCWVCLDFETGEDYSAYSGRPRLEGFARCVKRKKSSNTSNSPVAWTRKKKMQCDWRWEDFKPPGYC